MYEDWTVLSQRTRVKLLADANANYDRIVHRAGWGDQLKALLTLKGTRRHRQLKNWFRTGLYADGGDDIAPDIACASYWAE